MAIRELKRGVRRMMRSSLSPLRLWDYCSQLQARIRSSTAHNNVRLDGEVPQTLVDGTTFDISNLAEFGWYDWIKYRDTTVSWPLDDYALGRWLGPAPTIGNEMAMYILKDNGEVIIRTTLRHLTEEEKQSKIETESKLNFDKRIKERLGDALSDEDLPDYITPTFDPYSDKDGNVESAAEEVDNIADYDKYIASKIILPTEGEYLQKATVMGRVKDGSGRAKGTYHPNPQVDSREYEVMFDDGTTKEFAANVIAENLISVSGDESHSNHFLNEIIDHRTNGKAVTKDDGMISQNGRSTMRKTTKGWFLCVRWKDDSTSWVPLKDLKESNPLDVSEYAVANKLVTEPAFQWWVPTTLRRRDRIIAKLHTRYMKRVQKFGIDLPKTIKEAYQLDGNNNNTKWADAIAKEMKNVSIAFDILEPEANVPIGYQHIRCHLVFDVKMDFTHKARLVAGGTYN